MEQTSKLGIVVDTTRAASQIKAFSTALKQMEREGVSSAKALSKIGSGVSFSALNSSIATARASLSGFNSTANNMASAMNQGAKAAAGLRAATKGISTNLNAIATASSKISSISSGIDKARISSGKLGTVIRDVNKNILTLNSTLNTAIATLNRYGQAATTAAQRTTAFGQAATQSQTRLRGLDAGLLAARNNMNALNTSANGINAIFFFFFRTMAQLAAATNRLSDASTRAAAQIQRLDGGLAGANARGRTFMGTLQGLQGLLLGGMFSIATLGIIKTADEMQNLNSQIKLATNSEAEYLSIRQKVREIADRNYSAIAATTNLYQNSARALANLGKSQQDVLVFTDAVSLAMRTGGRSTQEQASAILQLSQSMSSNILAGDEFRSLAENAPILLELVAKRMGVLPGQLKELASEGKITGEIIYDALSENIGMLEEMAKKMPLTMAQAFTVAKNRYKSYVDDMMNQTGGMSSKIASMINGISANFETLTKVAIAGATLAFANMALSIGSASTAMAIFNAVAGLNPIILIAGAFIAVSSAIFGVNEVLDISGVMVGDFFDAMEVMIGDAGSQWEDFESTVARVMGNNTDVIADANDKNSKNFLGFYEKTEKGFAGVIQGISTGVFSLTNIFMSALTVIDNFILNTNSLLSNLGTGIYNAGQKAKGVFGGEDNSRDYVPYAAKDTGFLSVYSDTFAKGQDSIRDYARSLNERTLPKAKAGEYDPNYVAPLRSQFFKGGFGGVLQGGQGVLANNYSGLSGSLRNNQPSRYPMDAEKLRQKNALDEINALKASAEANKKLEAERKKQLASEKSLGAGYVSNTNLKGLPLKGGIGGQATAGGKIRGYTAEFAQATYAGMASDIKYFSGFNDKFHAGTSSKHATGSAFDLVLKNPNQAKKAAAALHEYAEQYGYSIKVLDEYANPSKNATGGHLHVSVLGRKKGAEGADIAYLKQVNGARASEAAKAEKERIKAAEEAQKERERIAAIDLKLLKEYGDKELQLTIEHDARVAEINESSFNGAKKAELIAESERRMKQELAAYKKGLDDKVSELVKFQKTERDLLRQQYDDEVFGIVSHPELSRPENGEQLKQALINAKLANDYRVSLYEQSLEQQKSAMYAFQKTERDVLIDSWDNKLADAELMYDELRDYRLEAIRIEGAQDINTFDTNQALKLLELKKYHMSEIAYIQARDALERKLIDLSNDPDDVKVLRKDAMTQAENLKKSDALDGVMGEIAQESPMGKIEADYQRRLEIIDDYESQWTSLVGVHSAERAAIEQSYMDAKRDLMLTQSEALFGGLADAAKVFVGEQSATYKLLYGIQKGFAIASAGIALWQSVSEASKAPIPAKWGLMATAAADGAKLVSTISSLQPQGFKDGGYTGNMGVNQVAGAVHGQEYVFDAQATKRIGVDNLNAMRSGKSVGGDVQVNIINNSSARVQASDDGKTITISDVNNAVDRKFDSLANPNSHASKAINRNLNATRRR